MEDTSPELPNLWFRPFSYKVVSEKGVANDVFAHLVDSLSVPCPRGGNTPRGHHQIRRAPSNDTGDYLMRSLSKEF